MKQPAPSEAIRKTIIVECGPDQAFVTWTDRINAWWPKGHAPSGDPASVLYMEPKAGGRFFERTPGGREHELGRVTVWEPPHRLVYDWYLGSGVGRPTQVEVTFSPAGKGRTRIEVFHLGPDLIGELWSRNSPRYQAAWDQVLPAFVAHIRL